MNKTGWPGSWSDFYWAWWLAFASMTTKGFGESKEDREPPAAMKIFWGVVMGMLSWVLLVSGGASALQTSVIVCGLPILVLQIVMAIGFVKAMRNLNKYDVVNRR